MLQWMVSFFRFWFLDTTRTHSNHNFRDFWLKNRGFGQKSKFQSKNRNFGQKSKFWSRIEILVKNRNFRQKSKFSSKKQILTKILAKYATNYAANYVWWTIACCITIRAFTIITICELFQKWKKLKNPLP